MSKRLPARTERRPAPPDVPPGEPGRPRARAERLSQRGKTLRAYTAYIDLLRTANWMRGYMRGQLESFDLTMQGFRVLEILYREGPTPLPDVAEKLQCKRQNVAFVAGRLDERGWVRRKIAPLPPGETEASGSARARKDAPKEGRRVTILQLTPRGEKLIGSVFPKHAKVVKSLMRVLDAREQLTLSRLLQKLREGDIVKFFREMQFKDEEEWESED